VEADWIAIQDKNPLIVKIVEKYASYWEETVITSIHRKKTTDSGVHEDWRGIDIRANDKPHNCVIETVSEMNSYFQRKDGKLVAIAHGDGANFHVHIQTPIDGEDGMKKKYEPKKTAIKAGEITVSASAIGGLLLLFGVDPQIITFLTPIALGIYKAIVNYIKNR